MVAVSSAACPGPRVKSAVITTANLGDEMPSNSNGTASIAIGCNVHLTVTKTNGTTTRQTGGFSGPLSR